MAAQIPTVWMCCFESERREGNGLRLVGEVETRNWIIIIRVFEKSGIGIGMGCEKREGGSGEVKRYHPHQRAISLISFFLFDSCVLAMRLLHHLLLFFPLFVMIGELSV